RVDDEDVKVAVIPAHDAGPVFLPECNLPLADHRRLQSFLVDALPCRLIYHTCITAGRPPVRRASGTGTGDHSRPGTVWAGAPMLALGRSHHLHQTRETRRVEKERVLVAGLHLCADRDQSRWRGN